MLTTLRLLLFVFRPADKVGVPLSPLGLICTLFFGPVRRLLRSHLCFCAHPHRQLMRFISFQFQFHFMLWTHRSHVRFSNFNVLHDVQLSGIARLARVRWRVEAEQTEFEGDIGKGVLSRVLLAHLEFKYIHRTSFSA